MKRVLLLSVLMLGVSACGLKRVPANVLDRLPYEAKIELLEAENDLALAVDRLDEARAEVARTRDQIRRSKARLQAAKSEVNAASDQTSREVAELAVAESEARVEWLRAKQKSNVREEDLSERNQTCAVARYEQTKMTAAKKAALEGSEKLEVAVFDQQVKDCDAAYTELREKLKESNTEAETVRASWEKSRAALAKKTFDARASPYVE